MYSILRNSALASKSSARTIAELEEIETQLGLDGVDIPLTIDGTAAERLRHIISDEANGSELANRALELVRQKMRSRPAIFALHTDAQTAEKASSMEQALDTLDFFSRSVLERTFFDINVDSSLSEADFVRMFQEIRAVARKLHQSDATIIVFLDGKFTDQQCRT
jgi:hypothetical protein